MNMQPRLPRVFQHKTAWVLCLALSLSLLCLRQTMPASAQVSVNACGVVSGYTAATALAAGSLTLNPGGTIVLLPGTTISGDGALVPGANVCVTITGLNGSVGVGVTTNISVCGRLDALSNTSITIAGQAIPIALGAQLGGTNGITVGSDVCLNATANALGQITSGGLTANVGANVSVCGVIGAISSTSITIAGQVFSIAPGAQLSGGNLLTVGSDVCLNATTNVAGQITGGGVAANVGAGVNICGVISAISPTSITIAGQTFAIATGAQLSGGPLLATGNNVCLNATTNVAGQITGGGVTANAGANVSICGVLGAISSTSITIAGQTFPIAAGAQLGGQELLQVGADLCLNATTNVAGQITGGGVSLNVTGNVNVCGILNALSATAISVGSQAFTIAAGTNVSGLASVNQCVCISAGTNSLGQISGTLTISPSNTCAQPTPTPTPTPGVTPTPTPTPTPSATPTPTPGATPTPTPGVTPTPTPRPGATPTPTPGTTPTPTPTPGATPTPTPGVTPTPTPTPGVTPTPTPTPGVTPTPTPTPGVTPTPTPTPSVTPTPSPTPGTIPTPNPNCGAAQVIVPASTFGFTQTANLPQGDLFQLSQRLFFTATTQPTDGFSVFPVTLGSFGGVSFDLGGFRGADLSGISLTAPGATFRAVTCTDSLRDINFVLAAPASASGDRVRLYTQDADGRNTRFLIGFTIENGVARVTEIDSSVQLFLNSRLGAPGTGVLLNGSVPLGRGAGTSGQRSDLLTLRLSGAAADCVRLGLEIVRGNTVGQTTVVFTDVTVNRLEVGGDRTSTGTGLLGGGTGGFPSGARCQSVCPTCTTRCSTICLSSPQFFYFNQGLLPRGAIFIGGLNFNNPIIVQNNTALIQNFLQRDNSALDRLNQEFIALQLSILAAGGSTSTGTQLRSSLSCYGASAINSVLLSNGVILTNNSTLGELLLQASLAARGSQTADQEALARLLDLINGNDSVRRCARSTATQ